MLTWFPIVGSILLTALFAWIGMWIYRSRREERRAEADLMRRRRRCCSYFRSSRIRWSEDGYRGPCDRCGAMLYYGDGDTQSSEPLAFDPPATVSPAIQSFRDRLRTIMIRRQFHPDTRAVLEVLDLMQRPAVREAVMPELRHRYGFSPDSGRHDEPYVSPEVTSEEALRLREDYRRAHPDITDAWADARHDEEQRRMLRYGDPDADQAARFFDDEPLKTPPPPNIGGEGHPDYAGPNYSMPQEIVDEMKSLRHYGTEPAETAYDSLIGKAVTINDPRGAFHGRTGVISETRSSPLPIGVSLDGAKLDDELVWVHYAEIA